MCKFLLTAHLKKLNKQLKKEKKINIYTLVFIKIFKIFSAAISSNFSVVLIRIAVIRSRRSTKLEVLKGNEFTTPL